MKVSLRVAGVINAVCLVVLLFFTSIQIPTFGLWFYEKEYEKNGTYEQIDMLPNDLRKVTLYMFDYLKGEEYSLNIETTVAGKERLFYSEREISHMKDVKNLFSTGFLIRNTMFILFILTLCFLVIFSPEWPNIILKNWLIISGSVLTIISYFWIVLITNFEQAFITFHKIFFNNNLWILDPQADLLINIVPTQFFMDIAIFIGLLFSFTLTILFLSSAVLFKNIKISKVFGYRKQYSTQRFYN